MKLVIIPTYNERENINAILEAVFQLQDGFHVLVIDDGSPDGTADIVRNRMADFDGELFLEERRGKLGLGTAYIHGFKWALERGYQFICEMDADFSHNPKDLSRLVQACAMGADVAVGSRYVKGGGIENWPIDRHIYSRGGSLYTRLITWIPLKDATAGFVCYKREVLDAINFDEIKFVGYAFQIEMKFAAWKLHFKIVEVPIIFVDRRVGVSKMNKGIIKEGVLGVLKIQWNSLFKNYRKKVKSSSSLSTQNG
ncbi:MAG TPA: polyprenol monophosphomannose synthase [Phnomibacter sp.]|nr:polyprenol monophosphomannose synthase [Phnomibacter sp.]